MAKKKSKADIIASYVAANPDATWSTAAADLERKGISGTYFASQRSKLKAEAAPVEGDASATPGGEAAAAAGPKKRGPKKGQKAAKATTRTSSSLVDAVEFARKAGGVNNAQALLEELARVQV